MAFNRRIPDRRYARGLCTNPNDVRFRANRNRPDVANVDIVSATIVQIRSCEKTQSDVLISLAAVQCSSSESSIEVDGAAVQEASIAHCCIRVSICKARERRKTNGEVADADCVAEKRLIAKALVEKASGIAKERLITGGRVVATNCVVKESAKTDRCVGDTGCEAKEGMSSLSGVVTGIASVRWWPNPESFRGRRKRKAHECEWDEKTD